MNNILAAGAAALVLAASPASASVVISKSVVGSTTSYAAPAGSTTVIDFNKGDVAAEAASKGLKATTTGLARTFGGTVFNVDDSGNDFFRPEPSDNSAYFGVGRNSSLTLTSAVALSDVSVFLGSLDNYNLVTFLGRTGNVLQTFTGEQIFGAPLAFPGGTGSETNRRVTFSATGNTEIFGIGFSNTADLGSFEFDNVALTAAVPEPATWAMMLVGFGMIGAASRYRRRSTKVTYA
jgi:hypothetical protein